MNVEHLIKDYEKRLDEIDNEIERLECELEELQNERNLVEFNLNFYLNAEDEDELS